MGCSGDREKGEVQLEEKWGYVVGRLAGPSQEVFTYTDQDTRILTTSNPIHAGHLSRTSFFG